MNNNLVPLHAKRELDKQRRWEEEKIMFLILVGSVIKIVISTYELLITIKHLIDLFTK